MNPKLNDLAAVLEEEIVIGNELRLNLAAQRKALVAWDMETLIDRIQAREAWVRSLSELETTRLHIVGKQVKPNCALTLSQLIMACPEGLLARQHWQSLRARARETFSRLQADERDLNGLMENLQSYFHEALKPLARPSVPLYDDTGAANPQRASSALIRNKA